MATVIAVRMFLASSFSLSPRTISAVSSANAVAPTQLVQNGKQVVGADSVEEWACSSSLLNPVII